MTDERDIETPSRQVFSLADSTGAGGSGLLVQALMGVSGVADARFDPRTGILEVFGGVSDRLIRRAIHAAGFCIVSGDDVPRGTVGARRPRRSPLWWRTWIAALTGTVTVLAVGSGDTVGEGAAMAAVGWALWLVGCMLVAVVVGAPVWRHAFEMLARRCAGFELLVALTAAAAWIHDITMLVFPRWLPAPFDTPFVALPLVLLAVVNGARLYQAGAGGPARHAVQSLRTMRPERVTVIAASGEERRIDARQLVVGDLALVPSGDKVPADGRVVNGPVLVDESFLTGEEAPVRRGSGDDVVGGCLNRGPAFVLEVLRAGHETILSRLIGTVGRARRDKPTVGLLLDRAAGTAAVMALLGAEVVGAVWSGTGTPAPLAISAGLGILLLACPIALGLASPVALRFGVSRTAEYGIVTQHADALQAANALTAVILNKTGTITRGRPEVVAVEPCGGLSIRELFRFAASLDAAGECGLGRGVVSAARDREIAWSPVVDGVVLPAGGAAGRVDGRHVVIGDAGTLRRHGVFNPLSARAAELRDEGSTPLYVAVDGTLEGLIALADAPRAEAAAAMARLRSLGLKVVMLSGDDTRAADAVAKAVGIERVMAAARPEDKAVRVRELQRRGERVGMIGSGTSDAAALAQADIGVAIAAGAPVAIESADAIAVRESLHTVADAFSLARATVDNIRQNVAIAFVFNAALLPVAAGAFHTAFGWLLQPNLLWLTALFAVTTVIVNAHRLRYFEVPDAQP